MPVIERDFGELYYRDSGEGTESVVLLHEYFGTGDSWVAQRAYLSRHLRVITPDLRGHGRSVMATGRLTISTIADDVLALEEQLMLGTSHLVGCSFGGAVALHLARVAATNVSSVVATSLPDITLPTAREYARRYIDELFFRIEPSLDRLHGEGQPGYTRDSLLRNFELDLEESPRDHVAAIGQVNEVFQRLLIICGEADPVFPVDRAVELARRAPDGSLAVLPGTGHLTHQELPGIFNELTIDHLNRPARRG